MSEHQNAAIVRRWIEEGWPKATEDAQALVDELFASDCYLTSPPLEYRGAEEFKQHVAVVKASFPDIRFSVDDLIAEGDKVGLRWTARGTHQGEWLGVAGSGKPVAISGTGIVRLVDGKIVEWRENHDALGLMQQVGAVTLPS